MPCPSQSLSLIHISVRMMSHRSSHRQVRPHHGLSWLAPHHCRVRRGQQWCCQGSHDSLSRAGRWQPIPSHPLSCDTRRQSLASQTLQTLDPEHKDQDLQRSEPAERRKISDCSLTCCHWSAINWCILTASTRLSADPRFSVNCAPSWDGTLSVV